MGILDAPGYSRAQADAVFASKSGIYGQVRPLTSTVVIGDSIDAGNESWFATACRTSGQKLRFLDNAGIGGNTTTQMLARFQTDVVAKNPGVVIIGGPTNDHFQNIAPATTRQNYADMVTMARNAGILPVLRTCPPCDNAGTGAFNTVDLMRGAIEKHNNWLMSFAEANRIDVFDIYSQMVDTSTRGFISGYTSDGTHPTTARHKALGEWAAANLPRTFVDAPPVRLPVANSQKSNGVLNGLFTGAGPRATSWNSTNAVAFGDTTGLSVTAAPAGQWQVVDTTGAAGVTTLWQGRTLATDSELVAGDRVRLMARAEITTPGCNIRVYVRFKNSGGAAIGSDLAAVFDQVNVGAGSVVYVEGTVPAGTVTFEPSLRVSAGGVARFAQMAVEKLY